MLIPVINYELPHVFDCLETRHTLIRALFVRVDFFHLTRRVPELLVYKIFDVFNPGSLCEVREGSRPRVFFSPLVVLATALAFPMAFRLYVRRRIRAPHSSKLLLNFF